MALRTYDVDRLMNNARIVLPGALDGVIQLELFNVLNDFFQKTNSWQESINFNISPTNTIDSEIQIAPNAGLIVRLMYVVDANNLPRRMGLAHGGELKVLELANGSEVWTARVALTCADPVPSNGTLGGFPVCPGWALQKYYNGVLSGTLARMMIQPAKPYTNAKLAVVHESIYERAVTEARSDARHLNIYAGQTWRFPRGFATSRQNKGWG